MSYDEYRELVLQTSIRNIKPGRDQITAAALGTHLRQASPDVTWKDFGIRTLSELLDDPWFNGKLEKSVTDKDALAVRPAGLQVASSNPPIEKFNPLRKATWEAFVLSSPSGRRFINRTDGGIRLGLEIAPTPADDWVEIFPIGNSQQREWAAEFIESHKGVLDSEPQLSTTEWTPHAFTMALKESNEALAPLWNRYRSARVSQVVQAWLNENALPPECAFQRGGASPKSKLENCVQPVLPEELSTNDIKQILLSALSSMPIEKLLDIPIPPRLIFAALSKNKLR